MWKYRWKKALPDSHSQLPALRDQSASSRSSSKTCGTPQWRGDGVPKSPVGTGGCWGRYSDLQPFFPGDPKVPAGEEAGNSMPSKVVDPALGAQLGYDGVDEGIACLALVWGAGVRGVFFWGQRTQDLSLREIPPSRHRGAGGCCPSRPAGRWGCRPSCQNWGCQRRRCRKIPSRGAARARRLGAGSAPAAGKGRISPSGWAGSCPAPHPFCRVPLAQPLPSTPKMVPHPLVDLVQPPPEGADR